MTASEERLERCRREVARLIELELENLMLKALVDEIEGQLDQHCPQHWYIIDIVRKHRAKGTT